MRACDGRRAAATERGAQEARAARHALPLPHATRRPHGLLFLFYYTVYLHRRPQSRSRRHWSSADAAAHHPLRLQMSGAGE
eukprot:scaffold1197_cov121-Isochrysis_galbana.AAC.11